MSGKSSGTNPYFNGRVVADAFEAKHGNGVCVTAVTLNGSTVKYFFGAASEGAEFRGTITGLYMLALGATGQTITVKGTGGVTVATITSSSSKGGLSGPSSALANTAIDLTGSVSVSSANAGNATDTSIVFLTYKNDDD